MKSSSPKRAINLFLMAAFVMMLDSRMVLAHASGQGFVLLLPTDLYIASGIATVLLTAAALAFLPAFFVNRLFVGQKLPLSFKVPNWLPDATSFFIFVFLICLLIVGFTGSSDPLSNPLTLFIWTVWWTLLLFLQGIFGHLWRWLNPWTGLYRILFGESFNGILPLPKRWTMIIGIIGLLTFSIFALADIAPDYPPRLAIFVAAYWVFNFLGICLFGQHAWLSRCECFTILFDLFGKISLIRCQDRNGHIGVFGWQIVTTPPSLPLAVFCLTALAAGSFDGLNETFWWLEMIGINPLEYPGRSAVVMETIVGIVGSILVLHIFFALVVWTGCKLVRLSSTQNGPMPSFTTTFSRLALSVLPIALGYHFAHFLPAFLVNSQYLFAALSDPLTTGADWLGLGVFYVTTGFFYQQDSVRLILLTQCAAIVLGHMIAVLTAHSMALNLFRSHKLAIISQIPMAIFMASYTFLSLWLLASPRGA